MPYPTLEEVAEANQRTLGRWLRFLPSPGMSAAGQSNFNEVFDRELEIFNHIDARFEGWTPELSKSVGW